VTLSQSISQTNKKTKAAKGCYLSKFENKPKNIVGNNATAKVAALGKHTKLK
jgi:hypothetical protein